MFEDGFPQIIRDDVLSMESKICFDDIFRRRKYLTISEGNWRYIIKGESINVHYRNYMIVTRTKKLNKLSKNEKMILYCIYSRNNNGYIRQEFLEEILKEDYEYWVIPYILKACDEYVVEILESAYRVLSKSNIAETKEICFENKEMLLRSYDRMRTYWEIYYFDKYPNFNDYVGKKLFDECFDIRKEHKR